MKRSSLLQSSLCIAALLCAVVQTFAQELVTNGGFETGGFDGWTVSDSSDSTNIGPTPALSYSGTFHANLGAFETIGSLSQSFATTPGEPYKLVFALANDSGVGPNSFDVFWNGASVLAVPLSNAAAFPYTLFNVNLPSSNGASSTLDFKYRNDDDFFRLDNVSVSAVPEATAISLSLLGFGLVGVAVRRRQKRRPVT